MHPCSRRGIQPRFQRRRPSGLNHAFTEYNRPFALCMPRISPSGRRDGAQREVTGHRSNIPTCIDRYQTSLVVAITSKRYNCPMRSLPSLPGGKGNEARRGREAASVSGDANCRLDKELARWKRIPRRNLPRLRSMTRLVHVVMVGGSRQQRN